MADKSATTPKTHTAPLRATRSYLERMLTAVSSGLQQVREHHSYGSMELLAGFIGRKVTPILIKVDAFGWSARHSEISFDEHLSTGSWTPLPALFEDDHPVITAAVRGGTTSAGPIKLIEAESMQLSYALHVVAVEQLAAIISDSPAEWSPHKEPDQRDLHVGIQRSERTSKAWIYDILSHLPGLLGADHSAGLMLPDRSTSQEGQRRYVLAAEQLFVDGQERRGQNEHLVGLLIPCNDGEGGLLEVALERQIKEPTTPYHLFVPQQEHSGASEAWVTFGEDPLSHETHYRFRVDADRAQERMLVLIPLSLPLGLPGFLSLGFREPAPIAMATAVLFERLGDLFSDALTHSDLFRLDAERLKLFDAFAEATDQPFSQKRDRSTFINRLTPALYERLGATSVAIGLLAEDERGEEILKFENPQGWDLDQPKTVPYRTADSLAALSMRLDRTLVLVGGHGAEAGALRWNNCLYVNEQKGLIIDKRLVDRDSEDHEFLDTSQGWRALSDYYRPTGAASVYAGLAVPLKQGDQLIGVFSLDFGRETPWHAYSGFAVEELYQTLSNLITSYLSLLEP